MRSIKEENNLGDKKVFVRADFNVPVENGVVSDAFRIERCLPTLNFILENGGKIVLASHIESGEKTLLPVFEYLKEKFKIVFVEDYYKNNIELDDLFEENDIIFLQNLRKYEEEKNNDEDFAKHLAGFADIYVNEAFSVSHRNHASIVGIPKFLESFSGLALEKEVENLKEAFNPKRPFFFVLGGAKFETKLHLIKKFHNIADKLFIGGALANDILVSGGFEVGKSLVSEENLDLKDIIDEKMILLKDVVLSGPEGVRNAPVSDVREEEKIVDVGEKTLEEVKESLNQSALVLWNGPLGNYENGFDEGTKKLASFILESNARSIIGGGDTIACLPKDKINQFSFVSTGGGAMLEFLASGTLLGIEALEN